MQIKTAIRSHPLPGQVQTAALFLTTALALILYADTAKAAGLVTISPKQAHEMIIRRKGNPAFVILNIRPGNSRPATLKMRY